MTERTSYWIDPLGHDYEPSPVCWICGRAERQHYRLDPDPRHVEPDELRDWRRGDQRSGLFVATWLLIGALFGVAVAGLVVYGVFFR